MYNYIYNNIYISLSIHPLGHLLWLHPISRAIGRDLILFVQQQPSCHRWSGGGLLRRHARGGTRQEPRNHRWTKDVPRRWQMKDSWMDFDRIFGWSSEIYKTLRTVWWIWSGFWSNLRRKTPKTPTMAAERENIFDLAAVPKTETGWGLWPTKIWTKFFTGHWPKHPWNSTMEPHKGALYSNRKNIDKWCITILVACYVSILFGGHYVQIIIYIHIILYIYVYIHVFQRMFGSPNLAYLKCWDPLEPQIGSAGKPC